MANLVTIYTSYSVSDIYIAKSQLEAAGILSFTRDEQLHQTAPYLSQLSEGIQLQVNVDDLTEAVEVLQEANILRPVVEKKDNFFKIVKWVFVILLVIELLYLLYTNDVL